MYLYIFEYGAIRQSSVPPTRGDIDEVKDGILSVIRWEDGVFTELSENGKWSPLAESKIIDTSDGPCYCE